MLSALRSATNIYDLSRLVGFEPSAIAYIVYKKGMAAKYREFTILKKHGGSRKISAPTEDLKLLQRRVGDLLQNCLDEMAATRQTESVNSQKKYVDTISHGFKRGRSIITNAQEHRNRRYVFNVDLKDFFGSINFGRVRGFLMKDRNFLLHQNVATLIAQIACYENSLPQGGPCSPVLSNLIAHVLDIHLVKLAAEVGCRYTRYADDLTFSTNKPDFPRRIAVRNTLNNHAWDIGRDLKRIINHAGFDENSKKTRMQYCDSRQEVTGLIVNRKVNVRSEFRHDVRAMVHHLFTTGTFEVLQPIDDGKGGLVLGKVPGTINQLHGMLGFVHSVDLHSKKASGNSKFAHGETKKEIMYRRFLLYKEFYAASSPVILCEGKTDNIYILHAIRKLVDEFPDLAEKDAAGTVKLKVRIFKYTGTSTGKILRLNGGTGDLANFIRDYRTECSKFKAPGQASPVIVLIDNDDGAKNIYSTVRQLVKKPVTGQESSIHISGNLYLCPTPLVDGRAATMIEDFFDEKTKARKLGIKTFNPQMENDTATEYGKVPFAHKIVKAHADDIDFSGFRLLLSNISAVIQVHKGP